MAMKMEKPLARVGVAFLMVPTIIAVWLAAAYMGLKILIWALRFAGADI